MIDIVKKVLDTYKPKRTPCNSNRASGLGYSVPELSGCLRRGVYERIAWQEKQMWEPETLLIFEEGNNQERIVIRDMAKAEVDVIEQQTMYEWKEYQITGHIDGKVIDEGVAVPIEIKSMSPFIFDTVKSYEDFKKYPWTRCYMAQITLYMLMQNHDRAIFILKNKSNGKLKQINVGLDYELGEYCIKAAEKINGHVKNQTLPDRIEDVEVCKDCKFNHICLPEISFAAELKIADDPQFEARLDRHFELKDAKVEYDKNYDIIKERARSTSIDNELNMMLGKYMLTAKKGKQFRLNINVI